MSGNDAKLQAWIEARKRYRLSHAVVQMARELGLNPKNLGGIANHRQERWKAPLPEFIAQLYAERFGKSGPDAVLSLEEIAQRQKAREESKRLAKIDRREGDQEDDPRGEHG